MSTVLLIQGADLVLLGPVIFSEIESYGLIYTKDSQIYLHYYIEFSLNQVGYFFFTKYIILKENSKLNISKNTFTLMFYRDEINFYRGGNKDI